MKSMFKFVLTVFALPLMVSAKAPSEKPYDYDLFSKDRECEYVELEALVMKVLNNQQIGSLLSAPSLQTGSTDPGVSEKSININNQWQPGFRVSVGYFNAPKYWEVIGQYTLVHDKGYKKVHNPGSGSEQYLRLGGYLPSDPDYATSVLTEIVGNSQLFYNDASALCSRNFYPNPHLRLRVLGGLTSMWTHQTTQVKNTFAGIDGTLDYRYHSKYWGVGFRLGTGADWYWGKDFYLTGKVFWSIVTGRWNTNTKVTQSTGALLYQPHDSAYLGAQNFQFLFGPSYQKSYEKTRLEIFVGYEFNAWMNVLTTYNYAGTSDAQAWSNPQPSFQDLILTGVNIRLSLDF